MATLHESGSAENDGEREVLRSLRDGLVTDWHIVSNFWLEWRPGRYYECDAAVFSPNGKGFLIEVKAWQGRIRGNDKEWELPSLVGGPPTYRGNPVLLTQRKAQVMRDAIRATSAALAGVSIAPLVVLVSSDPPALDGKFASRVLLARELVDRLLSEEPAVRSPNIPADAPARIAEALTKYTVPVAPEAEDLVGWRLIEQVDSAPGWDVWRVRPSLSGTDAREARLKRYYLDTLLSAGEMVTQSERARRDFDTLGQLWKGGAQVPQLFNAQEIDGGLVVVTAWPEGESLASMLAGAPIDPGSSMALIRQLLGALAGIHREGIAHRALSPSCVHVAHDGTVILSDFDFARLPDTRGAVTAALDELDSPYVAPEVKLLASSADAKSDVWSAARIATEVFAASSIPLEWQGSITAALSEEPSDRPPDATAFLAMLERSPTLVVNDDFMPNDELNERFIVQGRPLNSGGLSIVLKVFDSLTEEVLAAKFCRPELRGSIDPGLEYQLLKLVPDHPYLVKPKDIQALREVRRSGRVIERRETFLIAPWIEGVRLDELIAEKLPLARCLDLVVEVAETLAHLHHANLLHRDVKPENVLVATDGHVRLVDFNVSGQVSAVSSTEVGTGNYRPPDVGLRGWDGSADLYGLSLAAVELMVGERQSADTARSILQSDTAWPAGLRQLLLQGLSRDQSDRVHGATPFLAQLRMVQEALAAVQPHRRQLPSVPDEELGVANWNPYQHRLLSFFSQSTTSNAGTRGLDEFTDWFYVPTILDRRLGEDLVGGKHALVLITGNAGDGKTAFIQRFEAQLRTLGADVATEGQNGTRSHLRGHTFSTNWDGSQDEGDRSNEDVLAGFLSPFRGPTPAPATGETRVLAINEGRLIDFLGANRSEYPALAAAVESLLRGYASPLDGWLRLVNLNLRSLTVESSAVVSELLQKMAAAELWDPCEGCAAFDSCYARSNAAMLRHPVAGERIQQRVRRVLDLARLRRRLHITMRDLRSALAFAVVGVRNCSEIVAEIGAGNLESVLSGHLPNALFAAGYASVHPEASRARRDRLLALVGSVDVARTAQPELDTRLWTEEIGSLIDADSAPDSVVESLTATRHEARGVADRAAQAERFAQTHAMLRRVHFFAREDPDWQEMLPYSSISAFKALLAGEDEGAVSGIGEAISRSEGLFGAAFGDVIAVRLVGDLEGSDRTFVRHSLDDFVLVPVVPSSGLEYIEFEPDRLRLSHRDRPDVHLEIDLDLFETLARIRSGFRPSRDELRGAWLNLRVFKESLGSMASGELLLSRGERRFFRIHRSANAIGVEELAT